jgi:hypothetical protein
MFPENFHYIASINKSGDALQDPSLTAIPNFWIMVQMGTTGVRTPCASAVLKLSLKE